MKHFLFLVPFLAWGAGPTVTQGPFVDQISHSGLRVSWVASTSALFRWGWDTTSHSGATSCSSYAKSFTSNADHVIGGAYFAGLLASTLYYGCASVYDGTNENRAAEFTFTTAALPSPHPALPIAPSTVDDTLPTCGNGRLHCISGVPVTVTVSNCDDPSAGLVPTYTSTAWGNTIIVTGVCNGNESLPAKTGWDGISRMIITTNDTNIPAPGVQPTAGVAASMSNLFMTNFWSHTADTTTSTCYPGSFNWNTGSSTPGFYMGYCGQSATATVTNATVSFAGSPCSGVIGGNCANVAFTLSAPATFSLNQWGFVSGIVGCDRCNGSFQVGAVTDSQHFTGIMVNGYTDTTNSYSSGGAMQFFDWTTVSYTSYTGAAPSGNCTPGTTASTAWAYSNTDPLGNPLAGNLAAGYANQEYSTGRVWRCTATNTWSPHYVVFSSEKAGAEPYLANIDASHAIHTRFIGLKFQAPPVYNDPLLYFSGGSFGGLASAYTQSGASPSAYVFGGNGTMNDVVFDRCVFLRPWPAKGDIIINWDGNNVAIENSYFQAMGNWYSHLDRGSLFDNAAGDMISTQAGGPKKLFNNYIEGYGISAHFNEQSLGSGALGVAHDVTVQQNTFYRNFANIDQAPGSTTDKFTPLRQLLEFKRVVRADINGNIFNGNFQNVSQAAGIELTPEYNSFNFALGLIGQLTGNSMNVGSVSYSLAVNDWFNLYGTGTQTSLYQVASNTPPTFTFTTTPGLPTNEPSIDLTGTDGVSDINVRNNTFENLPTAMGDYSHLEHDYVPAAISENRIAIQNNIFTNIGPGGNGSGLLTVPLGTAWQTSGFGGFGFEIWGGHEDFTFNHNTIYNFNPLPSPNDVYATWVAFVDGDSPSIYEMENEGFNYTNNLQWNSVAFQPINGASGSSCDSDIGYVVANCFTNGNLPYNFGKNVTVRLGGYPGNYDTTSNYWLGYPQTSPFTNPSANNFLLTPGSIGQATYTCFAVPGDCTTDGTDSGVNMVQLLAAQNGAGGSPTTSVISSSQVTAGRAVVH
jgi:hypothetical protein